MDPAEPPGQPPHDTLPSGTAWQANWPANEFLEAVYRVPGAGGRSRLLMLHPALTSHTAFLVFELARALREAVEDALGEAGTGMGWPGFLVLAIAGAIDAPSQEAVCGRTGLDRGTVSRLCADLEYDGLLERRRGHTDGRKVLCLLTSAGAGALEDGRAAVEAATRQALRRLHAKERRRLHVLLARTLAAREAGWPRPARPA
jgi:DNA-binding MarR family transcriptional regulator